MSALDTIGQSLSDGFGMFWETLWALVLGFALSGAVQAFVSRAEMQRALGDHRPATVAKASFFGTVSSSCSYAASALAKTLFSRGADFTAAQAFMFASTNLVLELGIVLWLLIGWQFAVAEFVGGAIMIVLLAVALPRVVRPDEQDRARQRLVADEQASTGHQHQHQHGDGDEPDDATGAQLPWRTRIRSRAGWSDAAGYTISDVTMLRKELLIGFVVAGFAEAAVPVSFWQSLFWTGHGFWSVAENVVLGPFLAIISFVCSIGNVPLAAALWAGGISFGGVIAFVFADLITLPLLLIYRKYYGTGLTLKLLAVFWGDDEPGRPGDRVPVQSGRVAAGASGARPRHGRPRRVRLELHHGAQRARAGRLRWAVLALPQPVPVRRRRRLRQGPGVRDAGPDQPGTSHCQPRRAALLLLLRPLPAPLHRRPRAVRPQRCQR